MAHPVGNCSILGSLLREVGFVGATGGRSKWEYIRTSLIMGMFCLERQLSI